MQNICFLFPGQGCQKLKMGVELAEISTSAKNVFAAASEVFNINMLKLCETGPEDILNSTKFSQAAIVATSLAAFSVLFENNITANFLAGHSLGQYSALYAANIVGLKETFELIKMRSDAMESSQNEKTRAMCAIIGDDIDAIKKECAKTKGYVVCANFNGPSQTVISGEKEAVLNVKNSLQKTHKCIMLNVACAFHSELMKESAKIFEKDIEKINFNKPQKNIFSNITGNLIKKDSNIKNLLVEHITSPVLFTNILENIEKNKIKILIELGPSKTLSSIAKKTIKNIDILNVKDKASFENTLTFLQKTNQKDQQK